MKLILFDLDRTLFDTNRFIDLVRTRMANFTKKNEQIIKQLENKYQQLCSKLAFDPLHYSEFLSRELHINTSEIVKQFTDFKNIYSESVFDEAVPVLELCKKKKNRVGIFSEGNVDFQKMKINYSGLSSYVDHNHIYVFENKLALASIESLPSDIFIVDDKLKVIDQLTEHGIKSIWINRTSKQKHKTSQTIFSLNELTKLF